YPDIVTGQTVIHPPGGDHDGPDVNLHGPGTDFVLTHLWKKAHGVAASDANKAFVAGYLAHAAGDMYGHTYINSYTGGIFNLFDVNAVKHIALEGYIAERTNDLPASLYASVATKGIGDGVAGFIAKYANPYVYGVEPGVSKRQSFPYVFSSLRAGIQD